MIAIKNPTTWIISSLVTIAVSVIIFFVVGPTWGIDFIGGTLLELQHPSGSSQDVEAFFQNTLSLPVTVQSTQEGNVIVRAPIIEQDKQDGIFQSLIDNKIVPTRDDIVRFESIGPSIGQELRKTSLTAIGLVLALMVGYLAYEFRAMKGIVAPWKFGVAAIYALIHDIFIVIAIFAIFGKIWGASIDTLFVTALLTILGYSVNDTIVLFLRVKSEKRLHHGESLLNLINLANKLSLTRSINTALGTLLVCVSLLIFGGSSIRWFIAALTLGIVAGTYSSLFVAPPMLHYLAKRRS